jgi:hypothetical protein
MATTVAQPGTTLNKIARKYAKRAGMSVPDYVAKLQRLNPDYKRSQGSKNLRLGKKASSGAATQQTQEQEMPDPNQVANVLESPLYTQNLKDYYLTQYLPGLTQTTFEINQARNEFQANEAQRGKQRGEAIKRIAGGYAARGMRSPGAINQDRSEVQDQFANLTREEQNAIQARENQRDVLYGTGAQNAETFMSNPALFGSIGAGARRDSLSGLQQLPELYNLLGLGASTAPLVNPATAQPKRAKSKQSKPKPKPTKPAPKPAPRPIRKPSKRPGNITPYNAPKTLGGRTAI